MVEKCSSLDKESPKGLPCVAALKSYFLGHDPICGVRRVGALDLIAAGLITYNTGISTRRWRPQGVMASSQDSSLRRNKTQLKELYRTRKGRELNIDSFVAGESLHIKKSHARGQH